MAPSACQLKAPERKGSCETWSQIPLPFGNPTTQTLQERSGAGFRTFRTFVPCIWPPSLPGPNRLQTSIVYFSTKKITIMLIITDWLDNISADLRDLIGRFHKVEVLDLNDLIRLRCWGSDLIRLRCCARKTSVGWRPSSLPYWPFMHHKWPSNGAPSMHHKWDIWHLPCIIEGVYATLHAYAPFILFSIYGYVSLVSHHRLLFLCK